jgi:uncharacterized membrane protein
VTVGRRPVRRPTDREKVPRELVDPRGDSGRAIVWRASMAVAAHRIAPAAAPARLAAIDRMRGFVMVLMTVDHASGVFNAGRLMNDSAAFYTPGTALPWAQFMTRWMTHLCAPTFVFLAGTALALSVERRRAAGETDRALDRFILTRGLLIAALDPLWMSWVFTPGRILLQVLYAIGGSLVVMAALRRLSDRALLGIAFGLMLAGDALAGLGLLLGHGQPPAPVALLVTGGRLGPVLVGYPLLPWLAIMLLGWVFGRSLARGPAVEPSRLLAAAGGAALVVFFVVRGINGYGNTGLYRDDASLVQWLHVSKYPPSLAYTSLELGLMAVCLALLLRIEPARRVPARGPLLVFGQTALFFYLLHVHLLTLAAWMLGAMHREGLAATYLASVAALVVLYPACVWYRAYKRARPDGWTRYL